MTERQRASIARIRPLLSDVYRLAMYNLAKAPVGHMTFVRVPGPFVVTRLFCEPDILVHVLKDDDGLRFQIQDGPYGWRKGWTAPKWRKLQEAV